MKVGHLRRMRRSTSISGIFLELIVKNLISFLQFSVIKHLLNTLCSEADSLQDKMAAYEKDYYEYMVKRFFFNNSGAYRVKKRRVIRRAILTTKKKKKWQRFWSLRTIFGKEIFCL